MTEVAPASEPAIVKRMRARKIMLQREHQHQENKKAGPSVVKYAIEHPDELQAELSRRKLGCFLKYAWHVIEPAAIYKPNWHIDAICEHLKAVEDGEIRNLLINVPPRSMKSITISVGWPAFVWVNKPSTRFLFSSYAQSLAIRDALKSRRIIQSPWYQKYFKDSFKLAGDQNVKSRYDNDHQGYRISTSVGGSATGEGGDYVIVDDPHNVQEAESDVIRESTLIWWDEVMSSRLNDPEAGAKIIIMQRAHEDDLSGHVLEQGGYEHLMLPMEFDPDRKCSTSIGFSDPRVKRGELLFPDRAGPNAVAELKRSMGSYASAGQLQQSPAPRRGGMIKVDEINIVECIDEHNIKREWRSWDKAGTDGAGAFTVGARIGKYKKPRQHDANCGHNKCGGSLYFVRNIVRGRWSAGPREHTIAQISHADGKRVAIVIEQEPGSGGKESAQATKAKLKNRKVEIERPTGSKEDRADPFAVAVENGEVDVLDAEWNLEYLEELRHFPGSKYKDQVDATAQGFNRLRGKGKIRIG